MLFFVLFQVKTYYQCCFLPYSFFSRFSFFWTALPSPCFIWLVQPSYLFLIFLSFHPLLDQSVLPSPLVRPFFFFPLVRSSLILSSCGLSVWRHDKLWKYYNSSHEIYTMAASHSHLRRVCSELALTHSQGHIARFHVGVCMCMTVCVCCWEEICQ